MRPSETPEVCDWVGMLRGLDNLTFDGETDLRQCDDLIDGHGRKPEDLGATAWVDATPVVVALSSCWPGSRGRTSRGEVGPRPDDGLAHAVGLHVPRRNFALAAELLRGATC